MTDAPPPIDYRRDATAMAGVRRSYVNCAVFSALGGLIFVVILGQPFFEWLASGCKKNPYGPVSWASGPLANLPMSYFEMPYGTFWRDAGGAATGIVLIVEAMLYGVLMVWPKTRRPVLTIILAVAAMGIAANLLSAAMQWRAGFTQPLYALIGLIVCFLSATTANGIRREPVLQ